VRARGVLGLRCDTVGRTGPKELFNDYCDELDDEIASDKKRLKSLVKEHNVAILHTDKVDDLIAKLAPLPGFEKLDPLYVKVSLLELIDKASSKAAEKERKLGEYKDSFARVLRKKLPADFHPQILGDLQGQQPLNDMWEQVKGDRRLQLSSSTSAWSRLTEEARFAVFAKHIEGLRQAERERRDPSLRKDGEKRSRDHEEDGEIADRDDDEKSRKRRRKEHSHKHKKRSRSSSSSSSSSSK